MAEPLHGNTREASYSTESDSKLGVGHEEHDARNHSAIPSRGQVSMTAAEKARRNVNAKLANPLAGYSHAELEEQGAAYARKYEIGDSDDIRAFRKGACLAQEPSKYKSVQGLDESELAVLKKEFTNRWSQPARMYLVIVLCSTCAAVQGMGKYRTNWNIFFP